VIWAVIVVPLCSYKQSTAKSTQRQKTKRMTSRRQFAVRTKGLDKKMTGSDAGG
jgi:hypothetical protein